MVWDVIKIVLIVLGAPVALVLVLLLLFGFASCFNVGVRFSNYDGKLLVFRYGLLRFKLLPKKPKKELSEEAKKRAEEKKKKKTEKRKRRMDRLNRAWEKRKVRRAVRKEKRKARDAKKGKKPKFSSKANWLSEPVEGRTRAIFETVFDILPSAAKLLRFDKISLDWIVRGKDPAQTGFSYGQKAALFGVLYPWIMQTFNVGTHNVRVDADFAGKGESDIYVDITVLLRPIKIVGFMFSAMFSWFSNKDRYCVKPETTKTTIKMKPDGGNNNGRKTEND